MKISVAMTTYNGEKYLEKQIKSILRQTIEVDELVIVDDCSTDYTVAIIQNLQKQYSKIKLYINDSNLGYSKNFRKAISLTSGEYIFLCDQDDLWKPQKVEIILGIFSNKLVDVVCTQFELIDQYDNLIEEPEKMRLNGLKQRGEGMYADISKSSLIFKNEYPGCTCCFSKHVKDILLKLDCDEMIHDHAILLIGSVLHGVCYCNQITMQYRIHGKNNIGIQRKKRELKIEVYKPQKPVMVKFLQELNKYIRVPNAMLYIILCYLRIPFISAVLKKLIKG